MQAAAERFQGENEDARVTVGVSGTGGGFERFCRGETDISNASRPIDEEEEQACSGQGIEFVELPVANDALTVVANPENTWATCLTVEQLKKIWEPGSKVSSWKDVDPSASRTDYSASEVDNVIVRGVEGDAGALGYFGFTYFERTRTASRRWRSIPATVASRRAPRRLRAATTSPSPARSSST
jgi:phosphate transport system substrate-binding protein